MKEYVTGKKLVANGLASVSMMLCGFAVSFWLVPTFIGKLGAALYGTWLISGIVAGQIGFLDMGFSHGITRNVTICLSKNDKHELSQTIWAGLIILATLGIVSGLILFSGTNLILSLLKVSHEHWEEASKLLMVTGFCLVIEWPLRMLPTLLSAAMLERYTAPLYSIHGIIMNVTFIFMLQNGCKSLVALRLVQFAGAIILAIIQFALVRTLLPIVALQKISNPIPLLKKITPYSLGTFYYGVLSYIAIGIDSFILGLFFGPIAITNYNVISKMFVLIQQITMPILVNFNTAVAHIQSLSDYTKIERFMNKSVQIRIFIVFSMVFPAILILPNFIKLWVGEEMLEHVVWGQIYLVVPLFACLGQAVGVLRGCGKLRMVNTFSTIGAIFNFTVSLICVKLFGFGGVIMGTVATHLLLGDPVLFPIICNRLGFKWKPLLRMFFKCIFFNTFLAGVMYFFVREIDYNWGNLIAISASMGCCFALMNCFISLNKELRENLWSIFKQFVARFIPHEV